MNTPKRVAKLFLAVAGMYPKAEDFSACGDMRHPDDKLPSEKVVRRPTPEETKGWAKRTAPELSGG